MNQDIQDWKNSTWQIRPILSMPDLDPEAAQLAVLDSDPIDSYRKALVQNRERFRQEIEAEDDPSKRSLLKTAQMTSAWDRLFKATTGDQVYLLVPSRSRTNESLTRTFLISSNNPAGRRWLATKVVYHGNSPACWCVQVETVIGKEVQVELRGDNAIDLQRLYDQFITGN